MNVKLRIMGDDQLDRISVPIESATVVASGDLISYEGGYAVKLDAAAEDATFLGVSESQSKVGETDDLVVIRKCIAESVVASAAYTIGAALAYNASNGNLEASTANTIAWAYETSKGVSVTSLKVLIDVVHLSKLFPISA